MASQRRDPITIQKLKTANTPNGLGELNVEDDANWETHFACFAEVLLKGTREFQRAGLMNSDVSHLLRVPFSSETLAVNHDMRLVLVETGETLHICDAYRRNGTNREVEILCRG